MHVDSVIIRHSPVILLYRMLGITLGISLLYAVYGVIQSSVGGVSLVDNTISPILLFFTTIAIEAVALIILVLQWSYTTYNIRDTELLFKKGILHKRCKVHALSNVQTVDYTQSFLGLLFNYGTIRLYNPLLKEEIFMPSVPDPEKYAHILRSTLASNKDNIVPLHSDP